MALLPLAGGLGVVLLEAVRQVEAPTMRACIAAAGLVVTFLLGLATRAADLRWPMRSSEPEPESEKPS